ncbi:hypothetical protein [Flavobacterium sp. MK4S-17]|uniref:hypothetical protein n=1 Tax=Flavobacterium sp. MK4S-17 TaxID=2543737 RepID=UPI00135CE112|nr:hypothetical protein [Flavobacterium sp. MK4S-17]
MSNKKLVLGIAAGVAALAVVGVICKRKGYFDGFSDKAEELGSNLKDKFRSVKDSAKKRFDEVVHKGEDIAGTLSKAENASGKTTAGTTTNPATT